MRQTLDNAGAPLATASYDPWGVPQSSSISPFGFTGELQDAQGLTYLRARWYDAGAGRFHSRDPFVGWPETPYSTHYYQYAYSNPINWTDPSGRCVPGPLLVACYAGGAALIALVAGGTVANDPDARRAAHDVGQQSAQALQDMGRDTARGWGYVTSGDWLPNQEFFPLPPQEGQPFRLGPDLDEYCASLPGGFNLEQLDPSWWLRPGPALDGLAPRLHTGAPPVDVPATTILTITAGGGAQVDNIPEGVRNQIQRIADKYGVVITVVGSRAAGTATANSDWDYIIEGKAKARSNAKRELPRGRQGGEIDDFGRESGIDVWNPAQSPVDVNRPYITFQPR